MVDKWIGKVAIITGASAGIGAAIFKDFAKAGITVIGLARRAEKVEALIKELGVTKGKAYAYKCDVSDPKSVKEAFKWVEGKFGTVNILVNKVTIEDEAKPKLKLIGYEQEEGTETNDEEDIEQIIRLQNPIFAKTDHLKVVKILRRKKSTRANIIIEVDQRMHAKLLRVGDVKIEWSRCRVVDGVEVLRCFKCSRFSHKADECEKSPCCPRCMGAHELKDHPRAQPQPERCINCHEANTNFNLKLDESHSAMNSECPSMNRKLTWLQNRMKC